MPRAFVDFYRKNRISPVSQDISSLSAHFNRRSALYNQLGIAPMLLKGKDIIEFGPGSGHNALFTLSCEPRSYTFVDGNEYGLERTRNLVGEYNTSSQNETTFQYCHSLIEDFESEKKFDMCICEGLLPLQAHPEKLLKKVACFLKTGGILTITCIDSVSFLSDSLRKLMGLALTRGGGSFS